jgi:nucleotide-binding universal stress UspA family protein
MRVLVAVDVHDRPELAIEAAVPWARRLGGIVDVVYASEWSTEGLPAQPEPHDQLDALHAEWNERADAERALLHEAFQAVPEALRGVARLLSGRAIDALPDAAASYDLVVVSTHARHGLERVLLGSVAARVLRRATVPVLVLGLGAVPEEGTGPLRIACPVDEGEAGAVSLVPRWFPDAVVDVVHVLPAAGWPALSRLGGARPVDPGARAEVLRDLITERIRAYGLAGTVPVHLLPRDATNPGDQIASWAAVNDTDLIVMPTHGRQGFDRWMLGSVAERVAESAPCPVLVVPVAQVEAS